MRKQLPKLEVQRVRFSEQLEYLQSIKEVQFFNDIPDKSRETFPQEIREQRTNKKGLKVYHTEASKSLLHASVVHAAAQEAGLLHFSQI